MFATSLAPTVAASHRGVTRWSSQKPPHEPAYEFVYFGARNGRYAQLIFDPKHRNVREIAPGQRLRNGDYLAAPRTRLASCRGTRSVLG